MQILLIEDDIGNYRFLKQGLEEEGFIVDVAHDGKEGFSLALEKRYDILILDWLLPSKSGFVICKELRAENISIPIIFLTSKDSLEDTIKGLECGANDYMKKPFHFEELLVRINVQLRKKYGNESTLFVKNLELNIQTREVFKNGKTVHLTQKEFDLLKYLIKNKNSICTRESIIKNVWDIHFDYDTGVIDVNINALRKKLDPNPSSKNSYITTIRGIGYTIKE